MGNGEWRGRVTAGRIGAVTALAGLLLGVLEGGCTSSKRAGPTATSTPTASATSTRSTPPPVSGFVYVANSGSGSISVLEPATMTVIGTIPFGGSPSNIAFTPNGSHMLVTDPSRNFVAVMDPASLAPPATPVSTPATTGTVTATCTFGGSSPTCTPGPCTYSYWTGTAPRGLVVTAGGSFAYNANWGDNTVTVEALNYGSCYGTNVASVPVGVMPVGIVVNPNGSFVYVENSGSNNISVIATSSNSVIATINGGICPYG